MKFYKDLSRKQKQLFDNIDKFFINNCIMTRTEFLEVMYLLCFKYRPTTKKKPITNTKLHKFIEQIDKYIYGEVESIDK